MYYGIAPIRSYSNMIGQAGTRLFNTQPWSKATVELHNAMVLCFAHSSYVVPWQCHVVDLQGNSWDQSPELYSSQGLRVSESTSSQKFIHFLGIKLPGPCRSYLASAQMNVTWTVDSPHEVAQTVILLYFASDVSGLDEIFSSYQEGNFKYLKAVSPVLAREAQQYTFRCDHPAYMHSAVTCLALCFAVECMLLHCCELLSQGSRCPASQYLVDAMKKRHSPKHRHSHYVIQI